MKEIRCIQGSPEWMEVRCGRITASRIADVLASRKDGKESATRKAFLMQIVAERLTEKLTESYVSPAMEWGIANEPLARTEYELHTGNDVRLVGFVEHPSIEWAGASPDGLVQSGCLEIKCPNTTTHLGYLLAGVPPAEYQPQMLWQMACCEREWCDFVSYDPRLPIKYQFFTVRFMRDDKRIEDMEKAVRSFLAEVEETIARIPVGCAPDMVGILSQSIEQVRNRKVNV